MRHLYLISTLWIIALSPICCFSQSIQSEQWSRLDSNYIVGEITGYGSTQDRTPFWIQSNKFGIVPTQGSAASTNVGLEKFWNISGKIQDVKPWRIGVGAQAVVNYSNYVDVWLPQLYGSLRLRNWELYVGRKKQWVGLADSTLGMGSYVWSTNALPIPKIQIGTLGFVSVPFTNDWISFNAFYSEGIFEKGRAVTSGLRLHQKSLYLRLGRAASKLRFYGGFNHQVQWGGRTPYHSVNGKMPSGLSDFTYVLTGRAHASGSTLTHFDSTNRIGNHLGSIDFALAVDVKNISLLLYRQNIFEDGSLYYLNNISDGLNGIRFRRKGAVNSLFSLTGLVVEFLYTKSQGGPTANLNANIRGKDDYFNNAQVRDGWSYQNRTIGTPFILPTSETKWNWPVNSDFFTSNNRLMVWHGGLEGNLLRQVSWLVKFSYSKNFGTYNVPFDSSPEAFSSLLSFEIPLKFLGGTTLLGSAASDLGSLYQKTYGFSLGLRKVASLKSHNR